MYFITVGQAIKRLSNVVRTQANVLKGLISASQKTEEIYSPLNCFSDLFFSVTCGFGHSHFIELIPLNCTSGFGMKNKNKFATNLAALRLRALRAPI
jgi:hypothetical protein